MSDVLENSTNHFKKHKNKYVFAGSIIITSALSVAVTALVIKTGGVNEVVANAQNIAIFQWKPVSKVTVEVIRRGHPGLVVKVTGNGVEETYASVRRMCEVLGINRGDFWRYTNGLIDNVKGYTFEILGEASN